MSRSPDAELAILLELLSAQEALDEHRRRMSSKSVTTAQREDDRRHKAGPASQADALTTIEQALIKANGNIEPP
jgi:hypothetical protein